MGLYRQMIGRVLRPAPGKEYALVLDHAGAVFQHGFVEEPVLWTLDQDRRAENPVQAARSKQEAPGLTTCPECSAIRTSGQPCPACGWRPQPKRQVDVDGGLAHIARDGTRARASTTGGGSTRSCSGSRATAITSLAGPPTSTERNSAAGAAVQSAT